MLKLSSFYFSHKGTFFVLSKSVFHNSNNIYLTICMAFNDSLQTLQIAFTIVFRDYSIILLEKEKRYKRKFMH